MSLIIAVSGCEKAGKTTLIASLIDALRHHGIYAVRKHFGMPTPEHHSFIYTEHLKQDFKSNVADIVLYDRCFPDEVCYPKLMPQFRNPKRTLWSDPWLAAWYYDRALDYNGMKLMLLGPDALTLAERRTSDDHPIDPAAERAAFKEYGERFHWNVFETRHPTDLTNLIVNTLENVLIEPILIPNVCGLPESRAVFVETPNPKFSPREWLPFTSNFGTRVGREFGDFAFNYTWATTQAVLKIPDIRHKIIIAVGSHAQGILAQNNLQYIELNDTVDVEYAVQIIKIKERLRHEGLYEMRSK